MRSPRLGALLRNHQPRLKPPYPPSCFGDPVAKLDTDEECWELKGDLRTKYDTAIHPKLLELLFAIFGTASIRDWITLSVYMVGQRRIDALPTVMVCSEDENACRGAKRAIKKSGLLKQYAMFKVMCVDEDPGMRNMEQLASELNQKNSASATRAENVLFDVSKPLRPLGMEVWVDHGSSLRPTTAFMTHIYGQVYLRTVHHAFVASSSPAKPTASARKVPVHVYMDSDSDSESDHDSDEEDDLNVAITSIGSKSPDTWSDSGSRSVSSSASTIASGRSTPSINHFSHAGSTISSDLQQVSSRLITLASSPAAYPPKQIIQPPKDRLVSLGKLALSSLDKDWALIEITNEELRQAFERSVTENAPPPTPRPELKDDADVLAYTSSGGTVTGTFSGTPFCARLPNSTSFQVVYRVRLTGALANGDCGSAVRDAVTGELYGHIVAGCRATGTAYIMAAHQIEADFDALDKSDLPLPNHVQSQSSTAAVKSTISKSYHHQAVGVLKQPTTFRSQRRRPLDDFTSPPPPLDDKFVDIVADATRKKEDIHSAKRSPTEDAENQQRSRFRDIKALYMVLFGWLLSLFDADVLSFQRLQPKLLETVHVGRDVLCDVLAIYALRSVLLPTDAEPKSWRSSAAYYSGMVLACTIPRSRSIRRMRILKFLSAFMKIGILVHMCFMGYWTAAGSVLKPSSSDETGFPALVSRAGKWVVPVMALLSNAQLAVGSVSSLRDVMSNPPLRFGRTLARLLHMMGEPIDEIVEYLGRTSGNLYYSTVTKYLLAKPERASITISGLGGTGAIIVWAATTSLEEIMLSIPRYNDPPDSLHYPAYNNHPVYRAVVASVVAAVAQQLCGVNLAGFCFSVLFTDVLDNLHCLDHPNARSLRRKNEWSFVQSEKSPAPVRMLELMLSSVTFGAVLATTLTIIGPLLFIMFSQSPGDEPQSGDDFFGAMVGLASLAAACACLVAILPGARKPVPLPQGRISSQLSALVGQMRHFLVFSSVAHLSRDRTNPESFLDRVVRTSLVLSAPILLYTTPHDIRRLFSGRLSALRGFLLFPLVAFAIATFIACCGPGLALGSACLYGLPERDFGLLIVYICILLGLAFAESEMKGRKALDPSVDGWETELDIKRDPHSSILILDDDITHRNALYSFLTLASTSLVQFWLSLCLFILFCFATSRVTTKPPLQLEASIGLNPPRRIGSR